MDGSDDVRQVLPIVAAAVGGLVSRCRQPGNTPAKLALAVGIGRGPFRSHAAASLGVLAVVAGLVLLAAS